MDLKPYRLHIIGALLVLLSLLLVLLYLLLGRSPEKVQKKSLGAELSAEFAPQAVPAEFLFIPEEPVLLPKVILLREKRRIWTEKDASPFWTDPATIDRKILEMQAEQSINGLFDRVR